MEGRARLDRGMDEIADCRKQVEDLKYMMSEKQRQNMELQDELQRSKRVLDEKFFESGKLRDDSNAKGDQVVDLRGQVAELERDIDLVKSQRADMFREIQRLRDVEAMKNKESIDQCDRIKALDFDLQKTMIRIGETEKVVESRSYDIRQKSVALDDTEREIARVKDLNAQQNIECVALRKDVDRVSQDCYDLRKNIEDTEARNVDLGGNIRANDIHIKEKEDHLFACRKDIEGQTYTNNNMRADLADFSQEKEAMERHSRILLGQNDDLTKELERFVNTDEVLRQQLDRRGRVYVMQDKNNNEIGHSTAKIYEARARSPLRDSRKYSPSPVGVATRTTMATSGAYKPGNGSPLRSSYKPTYGKY